MPSTTDLLTSLDTITHETVRMTTVLDIEEARMSPSDRREAKRRVLAIRSQAQELFEWLSDAKLEEPRN